MRARAVLVLAALVAASNPPARAQDNPAIREAVRLAGDGRGDEARRLVATELSRAQPGDPAYIEALYWRARLTAVGDSAERDLRRIAIEYPTSRWAPEALLQLAQLAMAAGNPVSAFALAERLRSDYPDSELRPQAAFWAGRAAFDLGDTHAGCALLDSARTEGAADIEFANRVAFYRGRCGVVPAAPPAGVAAPPGPPPTPPVATDSASRAPARSDTARLAPATPPTEVRPATPPTPRQPAAAPLISIPSGHYTVQVAAARTDREEQGVLRQLRRAGYEGSVIAGDDGFRRIRVGSYATEAEALQVARRLRPVVGGRPFVVHQP
jgi:septal ring-binding cell division protein DamX